MPTFYRPAKVVVTEGSGIGGAALAVGGLVLGLAAVSALVRFVLRVAGDVARIAVAAEALAALVLIGGLVLTLSAPARARRRAARRAPARPAVAELVPEAVVIQLDSARGAAVPAARRPAIQGRRPGTVPARAQRGDREITEALAALGLRPGARVIPGTLTDTRAPR